MPAVDQHASRMSFGARSMATTLAIATPIQWLGVAGNTTTRTPWLSLRPTSTDRGQYRTVSTAMGYPRDMCHAVSLNGVCAAGRIGDGSLGPRRLFPTQLPSVPTVTAGPRTLCPNGARTPAFGQVPARSQVYEWEIAHRDTAIDGVTILGPDSSRCDRQSQLRTRRFALTADAGPCGSKRDQARIGASFHVAVINCLRARGERQHHRRCGQGMDRHVPVEPSLPRGSRTKTGDIYVEVIGRTNNATDEGAVQLVKKSVPYLIE